MGLLQGRSLAHLSRRARSSRLVAGRSANAGGSELEVAAGNVSFVLRDGCRVLAGVFVQGPIASASAAETLDRAESDETTGRHPCQCY